MAAMRTQPQSFVGGEVSGRMLGRPDDPKVLQGLETCRNFYVETNGSASNRPGTEFVAAAGNESLKSRLFPFSVSGENDVVLELGFRSAFPSTSTIPGFVRIYTNGATVLHSVPYSTSVAYVAGDLVFSGGVLYECILAHTNQLLSNATYWRSREWIASQDIPTTSSSPGMTYGTPGTINCPAAHNLRANDPVQVTLLSGATNLPVGLSAGVTYYAIIVSSTQIQLAANPGGSAISITSASGSAPGFRLHFFYIAGDLVSRSGSVWYCRQPAVSSGVSVAPDPANEATWYQQPASGVYEVPATNAISEVELFEVTYSQQADTISFASKSMAASQLVRQSARRWIWENISFAAPVAAPTSVVATATKRGATLAITGLDVYATAASSVRVQFDHHLVAGIDYVYIEGSIRPAINDRWFAIEGGIDAATFRIKDPETGLLVPFVALSNVVSGTVRVGRLNSEIQNQYKVTAVTEDGQESVASSAASVNNNLFTVGAYNTITWAAVVGAVRYRIYKLRSGTNVFGFIGTSESTSFIDGSPENLAPDLSKTPPIPDTTLAATQSRRPRAVAHFEGRRGFGGTDLERQSIWLTRSNTESDLSYSFPIVATDRIKQRLKSRIACTVQHMVPLNQLLVLTDTTEFRVSPVNSDALTPDSFAARAQTYVGAAPVQPSVAQSVVLFVGRRGGHIYQMGYRDDAGGYIVQDLCERATHLFDGLAIVQMWWQQSPVPIQWAISSTGQLLGCTYVPSQQVAAWHRHDTDGGVIESGCAAGESQGEVSYLIVRRTINGVQRRYIERMRSLEKSAAWSASWFLDCALRYQGAPVSLVSGLGHLEGKTVAVFADGLMQSAKVVVGGAIQLDAAASTVLVGLPIVAQLRTPPSVFGVEGYGKGRPKSVSQVFVRLDASGNPQLGPSFNSLLPSDEVQAGAPWSGELRLRVTNEWNVDGQLCLEHRDATPMTVTSISAEMEVGG